MPWMQLSSTSNIHSSYKLKVSNKWRVILHGVGRTTLLCSSSTPRVYSTKGRCFWVLKVMLLRRRFLPPMACLDASAFACIQYSQHASYYPHLPITLETYSPFCSSLNTHITTTTKYKCKHHVQHCNVIKTTFLLTFNNWFPDELSRTSLVNFCLFWKTIFEISGTSFDMYQACYICDSHKLN